jgi:hypothetical protein
VPRVRLRQARVITDDVLWDRYPVIVDVEGGTVTLEQTQHAEERWSGLEIEKLHAGREYQATHPELGAITILVQRGCACHAPTKTDKRGRAL